MNDTTVTIDLQEQGPPGRQGDMGNPGINGSDGADGKTILSGDINPDSSVGRDGDFYINRTALTLFGPKASGTWPGGLNLSGTTLLYDIVDPTTEGVSGDFFINTATWMIFGPKTTSWPAGTSLIGATGPAAAAYNYIINPSGRVSQDAAASRSDNTYSFDQWIVLTQSNPVAFSQLTAVEDGTPNMMRLTQSNASAQRFGLAQWIEKDRCIDLRGSNACLSGRVRMSASTTLRYAILAWTGAADTLGAGRDPVNDWTSATFTAGNFFKSTTMTVVATGSVALTANTLANITAINGAIPSGANNIAVIFWTDSTQAQNVTLDLAKAKLEKGSSASTFVPPSPGEELRDCQRHYYWSGAQNRTFDGNTGNATAAAGWAPFPVTMRTTPAVTIYGGVAYIWNTNGATTGAAVNAAGILPDGFSTITKVDGFPSLAYNYGVQYIADARL